MTRREQIFEALFALWNAPAFTVLATVQRNQALPDRLQGSPLALLVQHDGESEPVATTLLSPVTYLYDEDVELDLLAQDATVSATAQLDELLALLGTTLAANRALGGLADDVRVVMPPKIENRPVAGAAPIRHAAVTVHIQYSASDPLA